jgi:hypothetical protein
MQLADDQTFLRIRTRRVFKLRAFVGLLIMKFGLWIAGGEVV